MDGDIDYTKLSRAQLEEVWAHIDAARYPLNFRNLQRELEARPAEPPPSVPIMHSLHSFAVWPAAWAGAACGPIMFLFPGDHVFIGVAATSLIAWSAAIGLGDRRDGDKLGFIVCTAVPLVLLAASSILTLALVARHWGLR
jgi:hypothetical protein